MECPITWGQDTFKTNQGSLGNNLLQKMFTKYMSAQLSHLPILKTLLSVAIFFLRFYSWHFVNFCFHPYLLWDLPPYHKQLERCTKYMKELFSDLGQ